MCVLGWVGGGGGGEKREKDGLGVDASREIGRRLVSVEKRGV